MKYKLLKINNKTAVAVFKSAIEIMELYQIAGRLNIPLAKTRGTQYVDIEKCPSLWGKINKFHHNDEHYQVKVKQIRKIDFDVTGQYDPKLNVFPIVALKAVTIAYTEDKIRALKYLLLIKNYAGGDVQRDVEVISIYSGVCVFSKGRHISFAKRIYEPAKIK